MNIRYLVCATINFNTNAVKKKKKVSKFLGSVTFGIITRKVSKPMIL